MREILRALSLLLFLALLFFLYVTLDLSLAPHICIMLSLALSGILSLALCAATVSWSLLRGACGKILFITKVPHDAKQKIQRHSNFTLIDGSCTTLLALPMALQLSALLALTESLIQIIRDGGHKHLSWKHIFPPEILQPPGVTQPFLKS